MNNQSGKRVQRSPSTIRKLNRIKSLAVYIAFFVLFLIFAITLRDVGAGFLSLGNLMNILRQTSLIAVMAVGMAFVLGAAQIDLSIGSVVGLSSLVTALVIQSSGVFIGILAGLGVGIAVGVINGLLVSRLQIPSFLATLGTLIAIAGVSRTLTNLRSIPIMDPNFKFIFGGGTIGPLPVLVIWMLVVVLIGHVVLTKASFGRKVLATGGNPRAALYSGINIGNVVFNTLLLSSVLAALAGILWAGRFGGGRYSLGEGEELSVIAATVLGGTSIYGGRATVLGAAIGAIMIGMINNALILYGLDVYQQMIIRGIIIILAVAITTARE